MTRDIPARMAEQFRESAFGQRLETAIRQEREISELIEFLEALAALDAAVDTQARQQAALRDQAEKRLAQLRGTAD